MKSLALFFLELYKFSISPFLAPACRFFPTCSSYAREAVEQKGACRGLWLAAKRMMKCHPWHPGGVDVVK